MRENSRAGRSTNHASSVPLAASASGCFAASSASRAQPVWRVTLLGPDEALLEGTLSHGDITAVEIGVVDSQDNDIASVEIDRVELMELDL